MYRKRLTQLSFSLALIGALWVGLLALMAAPAAAAPPCPLKVCGPNAELEFDLVGACVHNEGGCAVMCELWEYTSPSTGRKSYCRMDCLFL